jgi:Fur family transcriptional regulator, ferric uptake regulator
LDFKHFDKKLPEKAAFYLSTATSVETSGRNYFQAGRMARSVTVMKMKEIKELLKLYGLKLTLTRLKVLEVFFANDRAVTTADLLRLTEDAFDRVTMYRTLKAFEDMGIIHRIVGANNSTNYALSGFGKTHPDLRRAQHLHFSCIQCQGVFCLDGQSIPVITLPDIYEVHSLNMMVVGICDKCRANDR